MNISEIVDQAFENLKEDEKVNPIELFEGEKLYNGSLCISLYHSRHNFQFLINSRYTDHIVSLEVDEQRQIVIPTFEKEVTWNRYSIASLYQLKNDLRALIPDKLIHKKYTREGMINRVIQERKDKAIKAKLRNDYRMVWGDNVYGEHILINDKGKRYQVFLRDFDRELGYSDSEDSKYNKLGTTKHIMYAFNQMKENPSLFESLDKRFPFIEIFLDPLNDYKISWHYPEKLPNPIRKLIRQYFGLKKCLEPKQERSFLSFVQQAEAYKEIKIRPEVIEKIDKSYEEELLRSLEVKSSMDLTFLKVEPYPYQVDGIRFTSFRKACILADEMGLGKTLQSIATALIKRQIFGFKKTLIVCPASLKSQWQSEIMKFTGESATIIEGDPKEREDQYRQTEYFQIINYETVLRDYLAIRKGDFDFLILDEAQRIKNYETKTFFAVKQIIPRHVLAITGTPIENKLLDIYSIMQILNPGVLGPLWEFSYKHCYFDVEKPNKINGYYNLKLLKSELDKVIIRREKRKILNQLPGIQQIDMPIRLSDEQATYHASYASAISKLIGKKFLTPADSQRLMMYLAKMRMVCNSTYLVDEEINISPKLEELERILVEKLDLKNTPRKLVIFSEWVKCHKLIGQLLRRLDIGFTELNGTIPVKKRGAIIRKFEKDKNCQVFLSTESGGSGLNLQVADILINFELPWNPAKKNQRIGRIDRLGQKSKSLTVINFITEQSIETKIAAGLVVKQNLFDGVLNEYSTLDDVDFSTKGKSQFLKEIEEMIQGLDRDNMQFSTSEGEAEQELQVFEDDIQPVENESTIHESELTVTKKENDQIDKKTTNEGPEKVQSKEVERVMSNGLEFLSGLMKMATGQDIGLKGENLVVDEETGEVTIKFKLPV